MRSDPGMDPQRPTASGWELGGTQGPWLGAAPNRPSFGTTNEGAIEAIPGALILSECCRDSGQIGCDPSRVTDPKHDRSLPRRPNNLG